MKNRNGIRDERTIAVENASYRWGYLLLAFGLLAVVSYRGFIWGESNWDLLALVVLSSVATTIYQGVQQVLSGRWLLLAATTALLAVIVAAIIAFLQ